VFAAEQTVILVQENLVASIWAVTEAAEDSRLRDLRKGISFRLAATQNIDRVIADSVPTGRRQRYG